MADTLFYRDFRIDPKSINQKDRSVDVSISSEEPYERWSDGVEIILHGQDNIDFERLNSALLNHDPNKIIGKVINTRIERKKARGTIVFDDDDLGNFALNKVISGSLKGVSIGYKIRTAKELGNGEEWKGIKGPALVATKTSIYEASLTPIPADATVGIGREMTRSLDGIDIETKTLARKETQEMDKNEIMELIRAELTGIPDLIKTQIKEAISESNRPKFGASAEEFAEIIGRAAAVSKDAQAEMASMLAQGKTGNEMQKRLLDLATTKPDASDAGNGPGTDGTGNDDGQRGNALAGEVRSFKQVTDEDFFASLGNPAAFAIN